MPDLELVEPLFVADWDEEKSIMRWMRHEKPDVVINLGGAPLHEVLTRGGWRIPQDLGFAWLACPRLGDPLSGIWQNGKLTGAMAVDTLISMVERHERGLPEQATTLMLEGQWNEGRTLRPLSK
jgi:hypothetical protein